MVELSARHTQEPVRHTSLPVLLAVALIVTLSGCRRKRADAAPAPTDASAVPTEVTPQADVASKPGVPVPAATELGKKMDPMKLAKADMERLIERFKEENNRWPKSLAEAGANRLPLPTGKKVNYNPATGAFTID